MEKRIVYPTKRLFKDVWTLLEGERFKFVSLIFLMILAGFFGYALIYLLGLIVDFFVYYQSGDSLTTFYFFIMGIAILGVLSIIIRQNAKLSLLSRNECSKKSKSDGDEQAC